MKDSTREIAAGVLAGERRALARSITLVESVRSDHRADADDLLQLLLPHAGGAARIGISGSPGAGKSTLIETLGLFAIDAGAKVAVLAVDPSSTRTGGSILGDKTRMSELGRRPEAYIRPTPSSGTAGGVGRRTREAILLCEAAGHDLVIVETVGVGQSEVAVADLVDLFVLIGSPSGGDELQGIKRGIMELADIVAVNKADGDLKAAAERASADLRNALHLIRPKRPDWDVQVRTCSALTGEGIAELWATIRAAHDQLRSSGALDALRAEQSVAGMWREVTEALVDRLRADPAVAERLQTLQPALASGLLLPSLAARQLLEAHGTF